jgi:hypothetical protein
MSDLHLGLEDVLKFDNILCEIADTLSKLFCGHGVFVKHPAEMLLVNINLGNVHGNSLGGIELEGNGLGSCSQFVQKIGGNGQTITSRQFNDFVSVTEGSSHNNGVVSMLFVVVEDAGDRDHTGIFRSRESSDTLVLFVPVHDATNKGRNQSASRLGASDGLRHGENQSQVTGDSLFFKNLSGLDSLPSGGNLDEDAGLVDTDLLVKLNDLAGLGKGGLGIERETGVDLSRDVSGNDLGDLNTKVDSDLVLEYCRNAQTRQVRKWDIPRTSTGVPWVFSKKVECRSTNDTAKWHPNGIQPCQCKGSLTYHGKIEISLGVCDGIVDQGSILRHACGLVDQRGVRGSILGLETFNGGDITGIADNDSVFLELGELSRHCEVECWR